MTIDGLDEDTRALREQTYELLASYLDYAGWEAQLKNRGQIVDDLSAICRRIAYLSEVAVVFEKWETLSQREQLPLSNSTGFSEPH